MSSNIEEYLSKSKNFQKGIQQIYSRELLQEMLDYKPPYMPIKKYYTPEISDLRVGYECEIHLQGQSKKWTVATEDIIWIEYLLKGHKDAVRTPYLTKEQIEADGWKDITEKLGINFAYRYGIPSYRSCFEKGNFFVILDTRKPHIEIIGKDVTLIDFLPEFPEQFRITIPCPSINELRSILKLIQ